MTTHRLFDMHGNVWEWVQDWYMDYRADPVTDPTGPPTGVYRILRGGGFVSGAIDARSSFRRVYPPEAFGLETGFRMVRDP